MRSCCISSSLLSICMRFMFPIVVLPKYTTSIAALEEDASVRHLKIMLDPCRLKYIMVGKLITAAVLPEEGTTNI